MKHAPRRGLRCFPRDSTGTPSGNDERRIEYHPDLQCGLVAPVCAGTRHRTSPDRGDSWKSMLHGCGVFGGAASSARAGSTGGPVSRAGSAVAS